MKAGKLYTIPIPEDSAEWNLSFYNAIACQWIVGDGDIQVLHPYINVTWIPRLMKQ